VNSTPMNSVKSVTARAIFDSDIRTYSSARS